MSLSSTAQKLFDYLPKDGSTVGGITIRKDLGLSTLEYKSAKDDLRESGLVVFGRGRGGSVARVEGAKPEQGPTPVERMAMAREAKTAQSRERRENDRKRQMILEYVQGTFPQVKLENISFYGPAMEPMIEIWKDNRAQMFTVDYEEIVNA